MDTRPITPAIPCQDNLAIYCQPVEVMAWLHVMKGRPVCGEHRSCIFCGMLAPVSAIDRILAALYTIKNADPLFVNHPEVAEVMRK